MLTYGLVAVAVLGALLLARVPENRTVRRLSIGAAASAIGGAATAIMMDQCGFAAEASTIDHLMAYGLMAAGGWLAIVITRSVLNRSTTKESAGFSMAGEIRSVGFRLGWWVPWVLLAPTLAILVVFLYAPAVQTFSLATKLTRLGAPRSIDVCFGNFNELFITDPIALIGIPLASVALLFGARLWRRSTEAGTWNNRIATIASTVAMLSVFFALYLVFSPGGGGQVAFRPVYVNTIIISVGVVAFGMIGGIAVAYLAFRDIRGGNIYRTFLIWPYAISPAVAGILFFMIFDPTAGVFTHIMETWFGIDLPNYREHAGLAQAAIIMASGWKILGYNILFYLAGLQTVPIDQIEASVIDGASGWQRFTKLVVPALSPITFFLLVTNLTYAFFEIYATIDFMTKGAPAGKTSVAIYEIIRVGVNNGDLGRGAAQSVLLFAAVIGITIWQFRTSGERVTYGGS